MPQLNTSSEVKRFVLPSTKDLPEIDQAFVDMEVGPLTAGDIIGIDPKASDTESAVRMLANRIKGWNFTDATGAEVPIEFDTVRKLDMEDFGFLADKIPADTGKSMSVEEKKT